MLQSSICIWFPFHRASSHISFIFRILMCCTVRSHCCDLVRKSFCMTGFLLYYQAYCTSANRTKSDMIGGECMSVYRKGRGNVRDRDQGLWRRGWEVGRRGIWHLLKKVREMGTFRKALEGSEGKVWGNEREGREGGKQVIKKKTKKWRGQVRRRDVNGRRWRKGSEEDKSERRGRRVNGWTRKRGREKVLEGWYLMW